MFQRYLLEDGQVEPLAEGVLAVLEKVGILCQNDEMLRALDRAGAKVDFVSQRVKFPKEMVEEFVEEVRKEAEDEGWGKFADPPLPHLGLQVAQFFYDCGRGERRRGNRDDFVTLIKLGDVLHPEDGVGQCLLMSEFPPQIEPLEAAMLLAEYAHKPASVYYTDVRQKDYLMEMDEILGGEGSLQPYAAICFAHPLRFDRDVAARYVREVRTGRAWLTPMPVAGVTTPITVEGFVVVASAEIVAGWLAARALNPEAELGSSMWAGVADMRGGVSYSSFDAMFYGFVTAEFMRRWCGKNLPVGGGEYCDAKKPGLYAALEKAYKAMTIAAFQGRHPPVGQGMLECGKTLCPEQLLLERELGLGVKNFARKVEPTEEKVSLGTILEVDLGFGRSHLETEHTLRHFRSSLWLPEIIDRSGWDGPEWEEKSLRRAHDRVKELLAQYRKPEVDEKKLRRMREVVERAKREMC